MIIYMSHPQHGFMNVYTDVEVAANEKNGWKRYDPPKLEEVHQEVTPTLTTKRGPGRPRKE